ncbi:hypothetical protein [Ruegeria sp.]|uniref:hypothetical protein n=1 Tax=Ruegeria sp. TaxID=1879320 RepID=UPI003C799F8C
MIAISGTKIPLSLSVAVFLGACAQSFATSSVYIKSSYVTLELREELVTKVYEKAILLGGKCKLINAERHYHTCQLAPGNPSLELTVGYNPGGEYRISVKSTYVHWLPQSERKITSGKYVGAQQKSLEKWMRSVVPGDAVDRAERTYLDNDTIQEF